jgi:hypothetical protein
MTGMPEGTISSSANEQIAVYAGTGWDSYQWYLDGVAIPGATTHTLTKNAGAFTMVTHSLTVRVTKAGVTYSKTVSFKVGV